MNWKSPSQKFCFKLFLFALIPLSFFLWQASLPENTYHFRAWEAALSGGSPFQSPFLPNLKIEMTEAGDLAPYTLDSLPKKVVFETDEFGFRNQVPLCHHPEVVVMGDSMAVGTSLTQGDTVSSKIHEKTKKCVRDLTGGRPNAPLSWLKFLDLHPKVLLLVFAERNVETVFEVIDSGNTKIRDPKFTALFKPYARFKKWVYWNYRLKHGALEALKRPFLSDQDREALAIPDPDQPNKNMHFFGEMDRSENMNEAQIETWIHRLNQFSNDLKTQGISLWITLVPNKESIYFEKAKIHKPHFYDRLSTKLALANFTFIDLFKPYFEQKEKGLVLYHLDDTHWNRLGVESLIQALPL